MEQAGSAPTFPYYLYYTYFKAYLLIMLEVIVLPLDSFEAHILSLIK